MRRADHDAGSGETIAGPLDLRYPKIGEHRVSRFLVEQHIGWFDVAMNDAVAMCAIERIGGQSTRQSISRALAHREQRQYLAAQLDIIASGLVDERRSAHGRSLERLRENRLDLLPALWSHTATLGAARDRVKRTDAMTT